MMSSQKEVESLTKEMVSAYFNHLNPIANKIAYDIEETKSLYSHLWYRMSDSEQNDIINETLIKPEISLKYLDRVAPLYMYHNKTDELITQTSADSLLGLVLGDNGKAGDCTTASKEDVAGSGNKYYGYEYDGRNLSTFADQKVSLKVIQIQDDAATISYRDEHSSPFNYRTKSQINFHIHPRLKEKDQREEENSTVQNSKQVVIDIVDKTSTFANSNIMQTNKLDAQVITNAVKVNKELIDCLKKNNSSNRSSRLDLRRKSRDLDSKSVEVSKSGFKLNTGGFLKSLIESTKSLPESNINYIIYNNDNDHENAAEHVHSIDQSGSSKEQNSLLATAASSTATSDDDFDDKTLCEDVKLLLDNDIGLKKNFDFLNNW